MNMFRLFRTLINRSTIWPGLFIISSLMTQTFTVQAENSPEKVSPKTAAVVTAGSWSEGIKEAHSVYSCTTDSFLVGRSHQGDENDITKYKCGTATQFGRPVTISARVLSANVKENNHTYTCPANTLMTGREHDADENGDTRYECGKATGELGDLQVAPGAWSEPQHEDQSSFECAANTVLIGREHLGDENDQTKHLCASLW